MAKSTSDSINTPTSFPVDGSSLTLPPHLQPDSGLQGVISKVQGEVAKNYDNDWADSYHGGDNYPSVGSKSKQGMD